MTPDSEGAVTGTAVRIAVVGGGPRGVSVAEQLVCNAIGPAKVDIFDSHLVGAGRIWHPEQSEHLLMNTHAREVTVFSGPMDDGPVRAGAGPSLEQWLAPDCGVYSGYAPRAAYGQYLRFALDAISTQAPPGTEIGQITDTVTMVRRRPDGAFNVHVMAGQSRSYDVVILATGHPQLRPFEEISTARPGSGRLLLGDSAADLPLSEVKPDETVATVGMGLAFHDVVALLTQGRGGVFHSCGEGGLTYEASGLEPTIVGVSRSGLPIPARGRNQKPGNFQFRPRLCTIERMEQLRAERQADFVMEVKPWILAEAAVTFYLTSITTGSEPERATEFLGRLNEVDEHAPEESLHRLASEFGAQEKLPPLESLARPFAGARFSSRGQWNAAVASYLRDDLARAEKGNVTDPLKAALDTLRDLRPSIRAVVDNGGLSPRSHERDFLQDFVPCYSLLVAGPPPRRVEEVLALIQAGIVKVAGPQSRVVEDGRSLLVRSPAVPGSVSVDKVIDSRIPRYEVGRCRSVLYPQLLADGLVRRFRHVGEDGAVETSACEVDPATGAAIGVGGASVPGLFVLGIPTERQRWFTQIGNGRPGVRSGFTVDAERIARAVFAGAGARAGRGVSV